MNLHRARRVAIIAIIVSLSLTAIVGIITLLGGAFGDVQGKVLLTTLLFAVFSISVLCHLAVVGRALQLVGFTGVAVSSVSLLGGLLLIWAEWTDPGAQAVVIKLFAVAGILAVGLAHSNLLLLLGQRRNRVVRVLLYATVAIIGLVALLLCIPIATDGDIPGDDGDGYWRLVGVVAILDVLGSIVLPVTGRFLRDDPGVRLDLELSPELDARLAAAATAAGTSKAVVAISALERSV
jgi:hypothetical protein